MKKLSDNKLYTFGTSFLMSEIFTAFSLPPPGRPLHDPYLLMDKQTRDPCWAWGSQAGDHCGTKLQTLKGKRSLQREARLSLQSTGRH